MADNTINKDDINIFNYYGLLIYNCDPREELEEDNNFTDVSAQISKDVVILPNTIPNYITRLRIGYYKKKYKSIIKPGCLPSISCITIEGYPHIIEEDTFQKGTIHLQLIDYFGDINECKFPTSLETLYISFNDLIYPVINVNKLLENNINLKTIYIHGKNIQDTDLYSSATCDVYINGIKTIKKCPEITSYNNILNKLNYSEEFINEFKKKVNQDSKFVISRLKLINNVITS